MLGPNIFINNLVTSFTKSKLGPPLVGVGPAKTCDSACCTFVVGFLAEFGAGIGSYILDGGCGLMDYYKQKIINK